MSKAFARAAAMFAELQKLLATGMSEPLASQQVGEYVSRGKGGKRAHNHNATGAVRHPKFLSRSRHTPEFTVSDDGKTKTPHSHAREIARRLKQREGSF